MFLFYVACSALAFISAPRNGAISASIHFLHPFFHLRSISYPDCNVQRDGPWLSMNVVGGQGLSETNMLYSAREAKPKIFANGLLPDIADNKTILIIT